MHSFFRLPWQNQVQRNNRVESDVCRYSIEQLESRLMLTTVTFDSPTSNQGDGTWVLEQREGVDVHLGNNYLYYNVNLADLPGFQSGGTYYVQINYYDEGSGYLRVQFDSPNNNFENTEFHARSSIVGTSEFVSSYHVLDNVQFANGTNGADFRIDTDGALISTVLLSDQPFPSGDLDWVNDIPWESPFEEASRDVDASTLVGKTMVGYQGWFNTPNDREDNGYVHWGQPNGNWHVDQWPDPNDYDESELFAVPDTTTRSGEQAYLFSSANSSVVDRHFQWMREHDIDGVFLQRFGESFMTKNPDGSYDGPPQWPLTNARDAAHREGRTWSIEYDIQKAGTEQERDETIQKVKDDWEYLVDNNGLDMLNDSHYQREDGKPVVTIFGLYLTPTNGYTTAQQTNLINYFQSQGVYVIGAGRHTQNPTAYPAQVVNAGLHDAYIPWQGYYSGSNSYTKDENTLNGVTDHIPHVFPGFSWTHLQDDSNAASQDRQGGEFYWRMLSDAVNETDAPWLFIGMFDEYDEATNLIPASDDPPLPDTDAQGIPLVFQTSDPLPNDWWMNLTGAAKQALQGKTMINDIIPLESELENRSNLGGSANWLVSSEDRLSINETVDSQVQTLPFTVDGETFQAAYSTSPYLYYQVDDSFLFQEADGRDVTILVDYLDTSTGTFRLDYESTEQVYENTEEVLLSGSGEWRTHRFEISNAHFANGQNGFSDFRIHKSGGNLFVRGVSVAKESMLTTDIDLAANNNDNGLTQVNVGDGNSTAATIDGRNARFTTGAANSTYLYFTLNDSYANEVNAGLNAIIEVVYQDVGTSNLELQYDSVDAAYKVYGSITLENSGEWKTQRFYLDDALFANRQNNGADFRLRGNNIPVDKVTVLRSFGDLYAPTLETATIDTSNSSSIVILDWSVADDWRTGNSDQWTDNEDNRVKIEWTDDDGATWNHLSDVYEQQSSTAQSSYDNSAGISVWSDQLIWQTSGLVGGDYKVRLTPIDGRENQGTAFVSQEFQLQNPTFLAGDYNDNGAVDSADYTVWRDNLGSNVTLPNDLSPGSVTSLDYDVWVANYGTSIEANSASTTTISISTSIETAIEEDYDEGYQNQAVVNEPSLELSPQTMNSVIDYAGFVDIQGLEQVDEAYVREEPGLENSSFSSDLLLLIARQSASDNHGIRESDLLFDSNNLPNEESLNSLYEFERFSDWYKVTRAI